MAEDDSSSSSESDSDSRRRLTSEQLRQLHLTCAINACGAAFDSKKTLSAHVRAEHRPAVDLAWHCLAAGCTDKVYTRKGNLQAHIKQTHERVEFRCTVPACGKSYHRRAHLKRHSLSVHCCDVCHLASFADKAERDLHRRSAHSAAAAAKTSAVSSSSSSSSSRKRTATAAAAATAATSSSALDDLLDSGGAAIAVPPVSVFTGLEPPPALPVAPTIGRPESVVAAELLLAHAAKHARLHADDADAADAVGANIRRQVSLETAAVLAVFEKFE